MFCCCYSEFCRLYGKSVACGGAPNGMYCLCSSVQRMWAVELTLIYVLFVWRCLSAVGLGRNFQSFHSNAPVIGLYRAIC